MINVKKAALSILLGLTVLATSLMPVMAEEGMSQVREQIHHKGSTFANATQITFGKTIKEVMIERVGEMAYYKFALSKPGAVTFAFKGVLKQPYGQKAELRIYDSALDSEGLYCVMQEKNNIINESITGYFNPGEYYLVIRDSNWNRMRGYEYELTLNYKEIAESFDGTKNNSFKEASPITLGQVVKGISTFSDDVDWYRFSVSEKSDVTISYESSTPTRYQRVYLFDKEQREITSRDVYWDGEKKKEVYFYTLSLNKGTYYVAVKRYHKNPSDAYGPYTLKVTGIKESEKPAVKSVTAKKMTYTGLPLAPNLTVKGSDGKALINNRTYSYTTRPDVVQKVGSYSVTVKGRSGYIGSKKATFSVNPAMPVIDSVLAAAKGFKLTFKKDGPGAENYQIQYSTSKKFPGSTTMKTTVKKGTKSRSVTGLSSNKTYYIRVRSCTKVKGRNYYSDWSEVKSVKTK